MDNTLQNALRNLIENKATSDELELLRQSFSSGQIFIGGNVQNSVIIVGSGNSVQLTPEALERLATANNLSALHQLPQPPTDFVGREEELRNILTNIEDKKGASISGLTGMGGVGKTALGLVAAHELVAKYSDAQFFIDMRGTTKKPLHPIDVMKHVVQSVYPTADLRNMSESEMAGAYHSALSEKKAILFLDNAADAGQVVPLLPPPSCYVIITSRWQFPVPGLSPLKLNVLKEVDAIHLLIELCPRITKENAKQIAFLCEYLPIALRLAGGYLQVNTDWSPEEYIANLSKKNEKIEALYLERSEINIENIFSQSYRQLTRSEKKYWSVLSIFPASFDLSAIKDVWGLSENKSHGLASKFCRYNIMEFDPIARRYRLHDLLTEYSNKKLGETNREQSFLNYLSHYYKVWHLAERLYDQGGDNVFSGLALFDAEWIHINLSYDWAKENIDINNNISSVAKDIPETVYVFRTRLHPTKQIAQLEVAYKAAEQLNDQYNQSKALGNIGAAYVNLGERDRAIECFIKALKIASEIGDLKRKGYWLGNIGAIHAMKSELNFAIEYYEKALEIAREIGDRRREGAWLSNIGSAYDNLGEAARAIDYFEKALTINQEIGNRQQEGESLGNIGTVYSNSGKLKDGIQYYEKALSIARELGDKQTENFWLGSIGGNLDNLGEPLLAIQNLEKALEIAREIGDRQSEGEWLGNIGIAYLSIGESRRAMEYLNQALAISEEIGGKLYEGMWRGAIGSAFTNLGELQNAIKNLEIALQIAREIESRLYEGEWLGNLSEVYLSLGEPLQAKKYLEDALKISIDIGGRQYEGRWMGGLGQVYNAIGDTMKSVEYLEKGLLIAREVGDRLHEGMWLDLLGVVNMQLGKINEADKLISQSNTISKKAGFKKIEGLSLFHLAKISEIKKQNDLAIKYANESRDIFKNIESPELEKVNQFIESLNQQR